jgi:Spy/CpxP family protein refolding chaperone
MSGSLHPTEIKRRRHRKEKRNKLRAQLAAAPAVGRAAIEAKLRKTYSLGSDPQSSKSKAQVGSLVQIG